jgi:hypothetical protein
MTEAKGITYLGFRSVLDSLDEHIGVNGKNAILRYVGMENFITDPPDYDGDKRLDDAQYKVLWPGIREIVGNKGYNSLIYRAGIMVINTALSHSEGLQAIVNLDVGPVEKMHQAYGAYLYNAGLDPEEVLKVDEDKQEIVIHRPNCSECENVRKNEQLTRDITKPGCAFIRGAFYQLGNLRPDLFVVETVSEVKCKLIGDDECLFVIKYEVT